MERFSVRGILSVIGGCLPIREMRYNALNGWDRAATPLRSGFSAPPYLSPHKPTGLSPKSVVPTSDLASVN
jgi:hypothetical protein